MSSILAVPVGFWSARNLNNNSYVTLCAIWYHLYILKNIKKKPIEECYFSNTHQF